MELAISKLPFASVSKRVLVHDLSYGNEFDLQDNKRVGKTHFLYERFSAPGLVLKQRQNATGKWPVLFDPLASSKFADNLGHIVYPLNTI